MHLLYKRMGIISPLLRLSTRSARAIKSGSRILMKSVLSNRFTANRNYRTGRATRFGRIKRSNVLNSIRLICSFSDRRIKNSTFCLDSRPIRRSTGLLRMKFTNNIMSNNLTFNGSNYRCSVNYSHCEYLIR